MKRKESSVGKKQKMPYQRKLFDREFGVIEWPYPIRYGLEKDIVTDVLVLGGGLSGCMAAINAAKKGMKTTIVEKGCTAHGGAAGAGIDHWHDATTNPCSKVTPEEYAQACIDALNGYCCGINRYISCRESYDTLLELEKMGVKIRDTEGELEGATFRDEETKLIFAYDYENRYCITIWGTNLKKALYQECKRLGVNIFDRVTLTSLLTEGGEQGAKVVGATGLNIRTGEFLIFRTRATVLSTGGESRVWLFSSEYRGVFSSEKPGQSVGEGYVAAWRAGAEFSLFEKSASLNTGGLSGIDMVSYFGGYWEAEWRPCTMVDANGKEIPWVDRDGKPLSDISQRSRPAPGQKFFLPNLFVLPGNLPSSDREALGKYREPQLIRGLRKRVASGEFVAPLYADLPSMPDHERRAIFGLHVAQEGKTWIGYRMLTQAGFDPDKHMLQFYPVDIMPRARTFFFHSGGLVPDWDLKTNLEGLYAAGEALLTGTYAAHACATGRYAGRKAAEYALRAGEPQIDLKQVEMEKARVYAPLNRTGGIDWKELNIGTCQIMQVYCSDIRNEESLKIGLKWLKELKETEAETIFARNPHELARTLESLSLITLSEMVIHASLARKASSAWLGFQRSDYPKADPLEWHKWITTKLDGGKVRIGERPIDYWGSFKENYEAHCGL